MLADLVAQACPRALRRAWLLRVESGVEQALEDRGVQPSRGPERSSCGAVVIGPGVRIDRTLVRQAREALGARGRAFVVTHAAGLPAALLTLSQGGLEPKRLVVHGGNTGAPSPGDAVLIVAAAGRRGGLVVDRLSLC